MRISFEQETALLDELRKELGLNVNNRNRRISWEELPTLSPLLSRYDVETLRFYTTLLAAGRFFEDFEDDEDGFSLRRGSNTLVHSPVQYKTQWLVAKELPIWRRILVPIAAGFISAVIILLLRKIWPGFLDRWYPLP